MKTNCYLCTPVVLIMTEYTCHAIKSIMEQHTASEHKRMCQLADIIIQETFFKKECLGQLRFDYGVRNHRNLNIMYKMSSWA